MKVKTGLSYYGKNKDYRCLTAVCRGECLDLSESKEQNDAEKCVMRSFVICNPHLISPGL
jgi:hypothetical protein